jgi:hypothetical protein
MAHSCFYDGFYLDGPIGSNIWSVYLCCGNQCNEEESTMSNFSPYCNCEKNIIMKVSLKSESKKYIKVNVYITGQPDVHFVIGQKMGSKLRAHFEEDVISNKKSYSNLIDCLFKCKRYSNDNLESIAVLQGFIIYTTWIILALYGQNVGQSYFSTYLSQINLDISSPELRNPIIYMKVNNIGRKYINCNKSLVKHVLRYTLMLSLDTLQQCLLSCDMVTNNWVKICLSWNRCIRPFFYQEKDSEKDLATSSMYGIMMCFTNCLSLHTVKNKILESRLIKLENKCFTPESSETSSDKVSEREFSSSPRKSRSLSKVSEREFSSSPRKSRSLSKVSERELSSSPRKSRSLSKVSQRELSSSPRKSRSLSKVSQREFSSSPRKSRSLSKRKCSSSPKPRSPCSNSPQKQPPIRRSSTNRGRSCSSRLRSSSVTRYSSDEKSKDEISETLAKQILRAESSWKIYVAKGDKPGHLYEFNR